LRDLNMKKNAESEISKKIKNENRDSADEL